MQRARDVDLLMLIREEAVYANRIKAVLLFAEAKFDRGVVPLVPLEEATREARRSLYVRPTSIAERKEEGEEALYALTTSEARRSCRTRGKHPSSPVVEMVDEERVSPYVNPPIGGRPVDDSDSLYGTGPSARVEFTYNDLIATREGRKVTTVRALRRLANLWDIDPKLNKEEMLSRLIGEYARRYEDEVREYESRRTSSRVAKRRRQLRRRR